MGSIGNKTSLALAMSFGVSGKFVEVITEDNPTPSDEWKLTENTSSPRLFLKAKTKSRKHNNRKGHKRKKARNGRK